MGANWFALCIMLGIHSFNALNDENILLMTHEKHRFYPSKCSKINSRISEPAPVQYY